MKNHEKNTAAKNSTIDKDDTETENFEWNLPDVKDIPGQENILPPAISEMQDMTISSDDEEGMGIFEAENEEDDFTVPDIPSEEEKGILSTAQKNALDQRGSDEEKDIAGAAVDEVDEDGEPLNEQNEEDDLDIPGAEQDDNDEMIGEEDEENNFYSNGDNE